MTRSDSAPSLEEYVTARGSDLVRLAWFLCGDAGTARDLVVDTLARALRDWPRLTGDGGGAIDTTLTRRLLRTFVHGHDIAREAGDGPLAGRGVWSAMLDLPRAPRAVLVLRYGLDQPVDRVADLLDVSPSAVATRQRQALEALGRSEASARALLPALVPSDPSTEGLASEARLRIDGRRRMRTVVSSVVAGLVVVAAAAVAATTSPNTVTPGPGPTTTRPTALSCRTTTGEASVPAERVERLSTTARAVLVCARRDPDSVWQGSLPPDDQLDSPSAIDLVVLGPRGSGAECPELPRGPAFRVLVQDRDGAVRTYENEVLACDGWPTLGRYYVALAEQHAAEAEAAGGFLGCPTLLDGPGAAVAVRLSPQTAPTPSVGSALRGATFTQGTVCLHPVVRDDLVPRFREVRSNVLGTPQLDQLNDDVRRASTSKGPLPACAEARSMVVVRASTATGRLVELSGLCGAQMAVDWSPRDVWTASHGTASMLRALLVVD